MKENFAICSISDEFTEAILTIFCEGKPQARISINRAEEIGRGYTEVLFQQFEEKMGFSQGSIPMGMEII